MNSTTFVLVLTLGLFAAANLPATQVDYMVFVDDHVDVAIDGSSVVHYDAGGLADAFGSANLSPGWHNIDIVFENQAGTSEFAFYQRYAGDPDYALVSFTYMRSRNEADTLYINGLYARYYLLNGEFQLDVYGEGPLGAGYDGNGPLYTHYEDQINRLIAGQFTGFDTFREVLSGQIWIGANPPDPNVPEPGSVTLFAAGMAGLAGLGWRRRLRAR